MVIKNLQRTDNIRIDTNDQTYFTKEGYLIDHPIVTRVGIFKYHNPDGTVRKEFRPPEEVFNADSLESYTGKPVIITHDAGVVNKDNVADEEIGTILEPGYRDGDSVRAKIVIHDTDAMKESGLKELSLGYNLDLDETEGEYNGEHYDCIQRNIRINHLALVAEARAGESSRLNIDGKDITAGSTINNRGGRAMRHNYRRDGEPMNPEDFEKGIKGLQEQENEKEAMTAKAADGGLVEEGTEDDEKAMAPEEKIKIVRDRRDCRKDEDDPETLEEAKKQLEDRSKDIDILLDSIDELQALNDLQKEEKKEPEAEEPEEDENNLTTDSIDQRIRKRVELLRTADRLHLDGVDGLSNFEIKKKIIRAVNPSVRLDGKSKGYINYAYQYAVDNMTARKDVEYQRQQMSGKIRKDSADCRATSAMAARERMIAREGGKN